MDHSMQLRFHGGYCCGVKTISGFGNDAPASTVSWDLAGKLYGISMSSGDADGANNTPGKRFFHEAAPQETRLDRLDRYLEYLDRRRPKGICEVVLSGGSSLFGHGTVDAPGSQVAYWEETLLERGFKIVNTCVNSNTHNYIRVYHRNSGEVPKAVFPRVVEEVTKGE